VGEVSVALCRGYVPRRLHESRRVAGDLVTGLDLVYLGWWLSMVVLVAGALFALGAIVLTSRATLHALLRHGRGRKAISGPQDARPGPV